MKNNDISAILDARRDAVTAAWVGRARGEKSLATFVNVPPGLRSIHPNEVPEMVALPVADGHHPYLSWVASSTRTP
jgi:CutA1 divalent ion tolerance protein